MELALYCPELGYYRRGPAEVFGARGDFYTAGQLQPLWGDLLASFVSQLQRASGKDAQFGVLDLGAGRQDLRASFRQWNYRAFDWNTEPLPGVFSGLVLANEFFDAQPVHLLCRRKSGWRELGVEATGDRFTFVDLDEISPSLAAYAQRYGEEVPVDGLLEASPIAGDWIARIDRLLMSGDVLVVDYGYEARELARFPDGTLLAYRRHVAITDLLSAPGTRDITAHVNFSYLQDRALTGELEIAGESSLSEWALGVWDEQELADRWNAGDRRWQLQWKQLIFGMGPTFRVLHLRKRKPAEKLPPNKNASVAGGVKDS